MILERNPLSMNEAEEIVEALQEGPKREEALAFFKKFNKTKPEQAKKIKEKLESLDLLKMKREYIVKIMDMLPTDASDLNKIFIDVSLNEDEINKILEIVRESGR